MYFTLTIQKPYIWRCKWVFFEIRGMTLSYPACPTLRIKNTSNNSPMKCPEQTRNYIWPSLSGPGFLQGYFWVPQVVVFIKSMTIFEVIWEWNIVHELRCLGLTFDVGEKMCRNLLDWILYQTRVSRYYFHYTIKILKKFHVDGCIDSFQTICFTHILCGEDIYIGATRDQGGPILSLFDKRNSKKPNFLSSKITCNTQKLL